ncbi:MAG: hypothetical protein KAW47_10830 [Thermoplasmatales archaeon]|nr:hypothetical protein [Thermoplasmatales archaeon]
MKGMKVCHNKAMHWNAKTKKCRDYKPSDFKIIHSSKMVLPDKRIPFMFKSKDGNVEANFFWEPNNVELRGLYGYADGGGTIGIAYPFANYRSGGVLSDVRKERILGSLIKRLKEIK